MTFPYKNWFGRPVGWKDLGEVDKLDFIEDGKLYCKSELHTFCGRRINVGKENQELFYFCPRCLIKL